MLSGTDSREKARLNQPIPTIVSVIVGVVAGVVVSTLLYLLVVGILSPLFAAEGEVPTLWQRAIAFGTTFGLVTGARWGLAGGYRVLGTTRSGALTFVKIVAVLLLALAIFLILAGDRWETMFSGSGVPTSVLVLIWLAMTWWVARKIESRDAG
jgi:hypothetical protein